MLRLLSVFLQGSLAIFLFFFTFFYDTFSSFAFLNVFFTIFNIAFIRSYLLNRLYFVPYTILCPAVTLPHCHDRQTQNNDAKAHGNRSAFRKAGHNKCEERGKGYGQSIGQLGRHMVDMQTLGPCRGHNRGIRDGRTMVTANRACHTG